MTEADKARGRVIGAAWHFMKFYEARVGKTADWPVHFTADNPQDGATLILLLDEMAEALNELPKCARSESSPLT